MKTNQRSLNSDSIPPRGYVDWQMWANEQIKKGIRQEQCGVCQLWKFPHELYGYSLHPGKATALCKECAGKNV